MKEKLIQLAKEKRFISDIIGKSVETKYSNKDFYYLWMCELQKWIREKHNIHIEIYHFTEMDWWFMLWKLPTEYNDEPLWTDEGFDTYEDCLEAGLLEALQLIK